MEVKYIQKAITFASTTSTSLGFLPPNAYVKNVQVIVPTAFNAGGTDLVDVGLGGTANNLADNVDVSATGNASVTSTATWGAVQSQTDQTEMTCIYVPAGATPTAGAARVVVEYAFNE